MMYFLRISFFICLIQCNELITIRCKDGNVIYMVECVFTETGIYYLEYLDAEVRSVRFNKLTDSSVLLPNHVQELIITHSEFDTFLPCQHIVTAVGVTLKIEDQDLEIHCSSSSSNNRLPSSMSTSTVTDRSIQPVTFAGDLTPQLTTEEPQSSSSSNNRLPSSMSTSTVTDRSIQPVTFAGDLTPQLTTEEPDCRHTSCLTTTKESAEAHVTANIKIVIPIAIVSFVIILILLIIIIILRRRQRHRLPQTITVNPELLSNEDEIEDETLFSITSESERYGLGRLGHQRGRVKQNAKQE